MYASQASVFRLSIALQYRAFAGFIAWTLHICLPCCQMYWGLSVSVWICVRNIMLIDAAIGCQKGNITVMSHDRHGVPVHEPRLEFVGVNIRETTSKVRITNFFWSEPAVTGGFPTQRASNAKGVYHNVIVNVTKSIITLTRRICQWHWKPTLTRRSCRLVEKYEHFPSYTLHTPVRFLEYCAALWPVHGLTRLIPGASVLEPIYFVHDPAFPDDVIKWKHFPRYWPFVWGIHRSPVNSPHKGQWRGDLIFSLICTWINGWVNNGEAGDLRRHRAHCDVTVIFRVSAGLPVHETGRVCSDPELWWVCVLLMGCWGKAWDLFRYFMNC